MKKILNLSLIMLIAPMLGLTSCSSDDPEQNTNTPTEQKIDESKAQYEDEPIAPFDDSYITVT